MAGIEMSAPLLRKYCKENGLYGTPSINDKLYLHYKGFKSIQCLEEYTGLKALWLEGNGLLKIENLSSQSLLRSLYLHENLIEKIEGLESQEILDSLNLSKNYIKRIENLSHMKQLTTLNLAHNQLSSAEDIEHIKLIPSIQTLDLQHNKIGDTTILDILETLPDLRVLYLMGNVVVKNIRHYRKAVISKCKNLRYLDDRPVFDEERRRITAWAKSYETDGIDAANEAERQELLLIRKEKEEADERNFRAFEELMRQGSDIRRQREQEAQHLEGIEATDLPTAVRETACTVNPFTGEDIIEIPESELVRQARENRWGPQSQPQTASGSAESDGLAKTKFSTLLAESMVETASEVVDLDRVEVTEPQTDNAVGVRGSTDLCGLD
jgi:dynein assembly factor 1